jgi:flagellar hook-associated protein 1 FlgK
MGLFDGIEMGKRALMANQVWLQTLGHNIANANTPGYARQRVNLTTTYPQQMPIGSVGTGVTATGVYQVKDLFLTEQYRMQNKSLGEWTSKEKTMTQLENILNEPGDRSINSLIDAFWAKWSELANNPDSLAARSDLQSATIMLTDNLHLISSKIGDIRKSVDTEINLLLENVNNITTEIAQLNVDITRQELGTEKANDLRDRRDSLVDELSTYVDVNVREQANGSLMVYIGSLTIVDGSQSFNVGTKQVKSGNLTVSTIVWENTDREIRNFKGSLKGLLELRDTTIPEYVNSLDTLAQTLVTSVNALHRAGYGLDGSTGLNFFDPRGTTAATISLSFDIEIDPNKIAASGSGEIGDNTNALAIADLRNSLLMQNGTATLSDFYQNIVGDIGIKTSNAKSQKSNFELLVTQVENNRQSIQGVSLDEEMAMMIKYQHAYDAAARVVTTMDEALVTIIQTMGVTGR